MMYKGKYMNCINKITANSEVKKHLSKESMDSMLLDILRIIATWAVLIGHGFSFFQITVLKNQEYFPYIQNIGVVLLFQIMGFLLIHSLSERLKSPGYSFKTFFIEKSCRIGVPYVAALLFVAIIDKISIIVAPQNYQFYGSYNIKTFIGNLFQLQDIPSETTNLITTFGSGRQFWTLSIEWWIYIFAGYIAFSLYSSRYKTSSIKAYNVIVACFLSLPVLVNLIGGSGNGLTLYVIMGSVVFLLYRRINSNNTVTVLFLSATVFSTVICGMVYKEAYHVLFAIGIALMILFLMSTAAKAKRTVNSTLRKTVSFFARYTYSLYLTHYSVLDFLYRAFPGLSPWTKFFIGIFISNIIAIPFSLLFDYLGKVLKGLLLNKKPIQPKK